jgi:hypothetical protein
MWLGPMLTQQAAPTHRLAFCAEAIGFERWRVR